MSDLTRRHVLAVVGAMALAGCNSLGSTTPDDDSDGASGGPDGSADGNTPAQNETPSGSSAAPPPTAQRRLPLPMSPGEISAAARSGGPPRDGIPSIDDPSFVAAADAAFLDAGDPVFGVTLNGDVKAYPQKILVQHEIVNDSLGELPVAVTYCPLTGTVQGFERGATTFGVSGRLINNNLVMYDRATETWWPQILATSVPSPWNGDPPIASLREVRLIWTTWGQWRAAHPDTTVLSTETGFARNYNRDPYGSYNPVGGYYDSGSTLFPRLNADDRYHPKTVFMGARTADGAVAFRKDSLASERVMTGHLGTTPVLAVFDPRFETGYVYHNPDESTFEYADGTVTDADGTAYDPDSLPLHRVHTFDAMWFAWSGYYPETSVYE